MSRNRDTLKDLALVPSPTYDHHRLSSLQYAQPTSVQLRDYVEMLLNTDMRL